MSSSALPPGRYTAPVTPQRRRLVRLVWIAAGVVALAVGIMVGMSVLADPAQWRTESYDVVSDSQVDVTFHVAKDPDATVVCTIEAWNAAFAQVGVTEVTIGPQPERGSRHQVSVATDQLAVTGTITLCELVADQP